MVQSCLQVEPVEYAREGNLGAVEGLGGTGGCDQLQINSPEFWQRQGRTGQIGGKNSTFGLFKN